MGDRIGGFCNTFSFGNQFLDWFIYAAAVMAAAVEFAGGLNTGRASLILNRWTAYVFSSTLIQQMQLNCLSYT